MRDVFSSGLSEQNDLLMRPSPFMRSFGDMSSSMIVILISIGRLVMVTLEPSEFGPGRLAASALRSEGGLHHTKTGRAVLHLLRVSFSMAPGFGVLFFDFPRERRSGARGGCLRRDLRGPKEKRRR